MKGGIDLRDIKKFQKLMQKREDKLYKIAYSYMKNNEDVLDCVQDSIVKALENFDKLKNTEYFDTWLVRILINTCKDSLRKRHYTFSFDENIKSSYDEENDLEVIDLINSLKKLSDEERELIYLRYFENKKIADISEDIDIKQGTVKSRLSRILGKLKISLE